ncbi:gas vesicle protein [Streptosporangium violaceochromogenes]|nr:gas vesicle protein [Streptosporangium violaceochromogenes]
MADTTGRATTGPATGPVNGATAATGVYLYAVAEEATGAGPVDLTGVEGIPVRTITRAGLVAYVSTVPLDRFGEEPLRRSLEDLDWVEETARAHHGVVEAVAETAPAAPVRLATVYSGDGQVRDLLDRRRDDFRAVLSQIAGRREWGVKAYAGQATSSPGGVPAASGAAGTERPEKSEEAESPGKAYLRRRQASLRGREERWREAAARADHVHAALAAVAAADRRHRPQDPRLSGRPEWMVLNGAYLVEEGREEEFAAVLDTLRGQGLDLQLTGPWAPYSFIAVDFGAEAEDTRATDTEGTR